MIPNLIKSLVKNKDFEFFIYENIVFCLNRCLNTAFDSYIIQLLQINQYKTRTKDMTKKITKLPKQNKDNQNLKGNTLQSNKLNKNINLSIIYNSNI